MLLSERSSLRFLFILLTILLVRCGQKTNNVEQVAASAPADSVIVATPEVDSAEDPEAEQEEGGPHFIKFNGTTKDVVSERLESFPAFDHVYELTTRCIAFQDSLEQERKMWGEPLTDPQDTMMVFPYKQKAYQAILDYKKKLATRSITPAHVPTLLELTRVTEYGDSSLLQLPPAGPSDFLSDGNFFFIGGAPFVSQLSPTDGTNYFTDRGGKPENRFGMSLQDNLSYLLTSVYNTTSTAINIRYGPPLHSYDMGEVEVYGVGSLIHEFSEPVPAFFISERGLVPIHLLSIERDLGESYNCGSSSVGVQFACSTVVDERNILGIYIPYGKSPTSSTFTRTSDYAWTVDLNNDGIADFACVTNNYMGDTGYVVAEALWYANINGTWKIIDWAQIPECT